MLCIGVMLLEGYYIYLSPSTLYGDKWRHRTLARGLVTRVSNVIMWSCNTVEMCSNNITIAAPGHSGHPLYRSQWCWLSSPDNMRHRTPDSYLVYGRHNVQLKRIFLPIKLRSLYGYFCRFLQSCSK